jgi:hypothetical protein
LSAGEPLDRLLVCHLPALDQRQGPPARRRPSGRAAARAGAGAGSIEIKLTLAALPGRASPKPGGVPVPSLAILHHERRSYSPMSSSILSIRPRGLAASLAPIFQVTLIYLFATGVRLDHDAAGRPD